MSVSDALLRDTLPTQVREVVLRRVKAKAKQVVEVRFADDHAMADCVSCLSAPETIANRINRER